MRGSVQKKDQKKAYVENGKTHTFIFTHAPHVPDCSWDGREVDYDPTHTQNDYEFVEWLNGIDSDDGDDLEGVYVEAVFAGHTHQNFIFKNANPNNIISPYSPDLIYYNSLLYSDSSAYHIETASTTKGY